MSIHVALPEREDFALKMTSLALLAFSGTGYTHFSKDQFSDPVPPNRTYQFGEIVKKGLRWLLDQEKEDGSFTSGRPELNTLAALTLAEYYGMTAMEPIKEPAARALAFARDQRSTDPDVLVWKGLLLKTAFMGELIPDPAKDLADLGEMTERGTTPLSISGSLLLSTLGRRSCDGARERFGELDWEAMTPEDRFMASLTVVRVFKHDSPMRQAWQDLLRWEWYPAQIATLDCGYGSLKCFPDCFETRILAALYTQLIFHQHYRYSSALLGQPL